MSSTSLPMRTNQEVLGLVGATILVLVGLVWGVLWVGHTILGLPTEGVLVSAVKGQETWTPTHTTVAVVAVLLAGGLYALDWRLYGPRKRITRAAKYMATPFQVRHMTARARRKQIKAMGRGDYTLPLLGFLGRTRWRLYFGPEDTGLVVTGPRQNKSSSIANPFIIEAPGPCLATSNKPGIIEDTLDYRLTKGTCYIYDPQGLHSGPVPTPMFWDPLSGIRNVETARMHEKATTLARRFMFASGAASKEDGSHWSKAGEDIMAALFLAAAIDNRPITDVYSWAMSPNDSAPVDILEAHGSFAMTAGMLYSYAHNPDVTRAGEYGNARTALGFLAYGTVREWVTPGPGKVEFDPAALAESNDTLYVLSQEGEGSVGPLTAALTIAVNEAATRAANANGGRLHIPLMLVLDEVANVAPWEDLPNQYSHIGSKGILPIALAQDYAQLKRVWGDDLAMQLLSSASIFITGGNVKGDGFHSSVVNMGPDFQERTVSRSSGKNGTTESVSVTDKKVLSVGMLRELPKQYSLGFVANTPTLLLRHIPTWRRRYKKPEPVQEAPATSAPVVQAERPVDALPSRERAGWGTITIDSEED